MKTTYKLTEDEQADEDARAYVGYGIKAVSHDGLDISVVNDLSLDKDAVEQLVKLCNELELDPIHLWDVAEDFLA